MPAARRADARIDDDDERSCRAGNSGTPPRARARRPARRAAACRARCRRASRRDRSRATTPFIVADVVIAEAEVGEQRDDRSRGHRRLRFRRLACGRGSPRLFCSRNESDDAQPVEQPDDVAVQQDRLTAARGAVRPVLQVDLVDDDVLRVARVARLRRCRRSRAARRPAAGRASAGRPAPAPPADRGSR